MHEYSIVSALVDRVQREVDARPGSVVRRLPWRSFDLFAIENVGNLVCPAIYDLGQAANVVALSVTEGEDKPLKYPVMFRKADLVLLTKIDLVPHLEVDLGAIRDALACVMPEPRMIEVSARTGEGIAEWPLPSRMMSWKCGTVGR